ncbi:alpha/beta hydrolase family protein [Calidithermus timidus]|jgi:dipeptidyl aminopeptidase/acylaminoacyl peptidase|uniref:alpha/beta hydrolase family protein n=1 Tax=Calidithermus timidus TaxID=307124 RepID=UPI00035E1FC9|nr:alpha/beta fold hydrolase [Calidithermus timidus]
MRWLALLLLLGAVQAQQTIAELRARSYGEGELTLERTLAQNRDFTRYLVRWPSEGLIQYGFMNVPSGKGPYPVVLVLHGYVNPATYRTLAYTTRYADAIARMGYVVIHPNYRGHPPSQGSPEGVFRVNYAIDVLNLAAIVRRQSGEGPLAKADGSRMGLWGHSMGGGIALRVAVVDPRVRAVVLYGSMSGDERKNASQIYYVYSGRTRGLTELNAPDERIKAISPIYHLQNARAAFSVHHGTADEQVPYAWSVELCQKLKALGKSAECFSYRDARHIFPSGSRADAIFIAKVQDFFARTLKGADRR